MAPRRDSESEHKCWGLPCAVPTLPLSHTPSTHRTKTLSDKAVASMQKVLSPRCSYKLRNEHKRSREVRVNTDQVPATPDRPGTNHDEQK